MEIVLILTAGWLLMNVFAVSLCVSAKRGDQVILTPAPAAIVDDPGFLLTFAEPKVAVTRAPAAPLRSRSTH